MHKDVFCCCFLRPYRLMANTQEVTESETRKPQLIRHGVAFRCFIGVQRGQASVFDKEKVRGLWLREGSAT